MTPKDIKFITQYTTKLVLFVASVTGQVSVPERWRFAAEIYDVRMKLTFDLLDVKY